MSSGARNRIHRYDSDSMASYWIVVPRGNPELYDLLSVAFEGQAGFSVILDRRHGYDAASDDRRALRVPLDHDEFVVAEQAERSPDAERSVEERMHRYTGHRLPVRRRRHRRPVVRTSTPPDHSFSL
jgi:hypothetical protein